MSHKCFLLDTFENIQHQCPLPASADQNNFREDTCLDLWAQVSHCFCLFGSFLLEQRIFPSPWREAVTCTGRCMGRHTYRGDLELCSFFFKRGSRYCQLQLPGGHGYCAGNADNSKSQLNLLHEYIGSKALPGLQSCSGGLLFWHCRKAYVQCCSWHVLPKVGGRSR